jgi:acyltransferase
MRSGAIDAVRVIGISAVIAGHCLAEPWVRPALYSWHVPLFFFLAGYFWSEHRSVKTELVTRSRSLGRPFLSWLFIIAVAFLPLDTQLEGFRPELITEPFRDGQSSVRPYTTFWFVSVLFFTIILRRLLDRLPRPVTWAVAGAGALSAPFLGSALAHTPLGVGSAIPCLAFLLIGTATHALRPKITRPGLVGGALLAVSTAVIVTHVAAPLDIKQGDYGTPVISIVSSSAISFGLILLVETAFVHLPARIARSATTLAESGFAVVLLHPLILWTLITFAPTLDRWEVFFVTFLTAWGVAALIRKTSAAPWLTGTPRTITA